MFAVSVADLPHKGRGVVAEKNFAVGDVIEVCPVIPMTPEELKNYEGTILDQYIYEWANPDDGAVVLGYGFLYNHSYTPNAMYTRDFSTNTITYHAVKPIRTGEEITVNYNGEPDNPDPIDWFEVK